MIDWKGFLLFIGNNEFIGELCLTTLPELKVMTIFVLDFRHAGNSKTNEVWVDLVQVSPFSLYD